MQLRALRKALLAWYDAVARDLPWRRTRDPYAIWVAEIMLQQTRVDTVVRYYERFLERFPTTHTLAAASEDQVMAAWSGLGYYRRARLLHSGVREVVARYGGAVPEAPETRRGLPGIGRYTAGAIGSIAFDRSEALVDGNVARVLSRLYGIEGAPTAAVTQKRLWHEAERLVEGPRPGALNQALMELGATVCAKQRPRCDACPVARACVARQEGRQTELPTTRKKPQPREVALVALLATRTRGRRRELWLERDTGSLFAGLWNLPLAEGHGHDDACKLLAARRLSAKLAGCPEGELEHVLTHRKLRVELWRADAAAGKAHARLRPVDLAELPRLGVSKLTQKALAVFGLDVQTLLS